MKALNLLVELREVDYREFGASKEDLKVYDEAIAELEALQQRSCDGCKYGEIDKFEQYRVTCRNKLALFNQMINADFCCNRYEAKEQ